MPARSTITSNRSTSTNWCARRSHLQQRACADAGLALDESLAPLPPVRGDARRLAQLIDNLLANARRYTDAPGRIRVELADGRAARAADHRGHARPVFRPASLPRLFERLYRVEGSRTRSAGGAGLGLAICRAIVDAHGGTIEAQAFAARRPVHRRAPAVRRGAST